MSFLYSNYTKHGVIMPNLSKMFASSSFTEEAASLMTKTDSEQDAASLESERSPENPESFKRHQNSAGNIFSSQAPLYLFYFMRPEDSFQAILINIIYRLRLTFSNIGKRDEHSSCLALSSS